MVLAIETKKNACNASWWFDNSWDKPEIKEKQSLYQQLEFRERENRRLEGNVERERKKKRESIEMFGGKR